MQFTAVNESTKEELLKAAQSALGILDTLPPDTDRLPVIDTVNAIQREIEEFQSLSEPEAPDVFVASLAALYGYCYVWAFGCEWKHGPEDEGSLLYVVSTKRTGWVNPSDSIATAIRGESMMPLPTSFEMFGELEQKAQAL